MNHSPAFSAANVSTPSLQTGNTGSATWINKLKIVGRGQNWAVAPCEPFYLMGTEPPAPDAALTGSKNLIEHYGLENAYQKFCGKRLKEELSAFLPHLSGNIDVPASVDGSGLMSLIERPPIRGKELRPFAPNQLDHAFRLHPGPLPQEYSSLFAAAPPKHIQPSGQDQQQQHLFASGTSVAGSRIPATAAPGSGLPHRRRRRHEVHRGTLASGSDSSSSMGISGIGGNVSASPASFFTGPSSSYTQLGPVHPTTAAPLSSNQLPSQTPGIPSSVGVANANVTLPNNVSEPTQSLHGIESSLSQTVSINKPVDHPPGLIPASLPHAPSVPSIPTLSSDPPPPPPPLLAPIHHQSSSSSLGQKLPHSNQNNVSSMNSVYNSGTTVNANLTPTKSNPPVLHSIHSSNTNNPVSTSLPPVHSNHHHHHHHPHHQFYPQQQQQQQQTHHYHQHNLHLSQSYPSSLSQNSSRSMSPIIPMETNSSPPSPDMHKIRRSDMTDEERRKKKRREKKRRKDKE